MVTPFYQDGDSVFQNGLYIGRETIDPTPWACSPQGLCRNADAALASAAIPIQLGTIARPAQSSGCEACAVPTDIDANNPTLIITSRWNSVVENETLHKIGFTTGWTYGVVEDKCTNRTLGDGITRLCADRVDYSTNEGDSGGPVFALKGDGTIELRGITFGRAEYPGDNYDGLMSNLGQIENDLGPLTVFDPGSASVTILGPTEVRTGDECRWDAVITGGLAPFSDVQWSGAISASGGSIYATPSASGQIQALVTDRLGRPSSAVINVQLSPNFPHCPEA